MHRFDSIMKGGLAVALLLAVCACAAQGEFKGSGQIHRDQITTQP